MGDANTAGDARATADEAEAASPSAAPTTVFDVLNPEIDRSLRRLPRLFAQALRLVWEADRPDVIILVGLQVLSGVTLAAQLLIGRSVLAKVIAAAGDVATRPSIGDIAPGLIALAGITALSAFTMAAGPERQRVLGERVGRAAMGRIIDGTTAVELEAFESSGFHDHYERAATNAQIRPLALAQGLLTVGAGLLRMLGIAVVLAAIEPLFLPLLIFAAVPLWLANRANSRATYRFAYGLTPADRERMYLQALLTSKGAAKEVRAFRLTGFLRSRFELLWDERLRELETVSRARLRRSLVAGAAFSAILATAVFGLVWLVLQGRISVADAGVAAVAMQQLAQQLRSINGGASKLYECTLFLEDVSSFFDLAPAAAAARPMEPAPEQFTRLAVDHLSFAYPGTTRQVLDDVTLAINAGEVVALVGENGSGKTTLAKLLCGLYQPTDGRILWDDHNTAAMDQEQLRSRIAVIFQDFVQYELTASENIGIGRHEWLDRLSTIEAAARTADAHDFLAALPDGYQSRLSRAWVGGSQLSVGQWQRVALARAFFADAPFLVLDEPTAALDPRAEASLFSTIRNLAAGRTVLLISHRFSSVRAADRIFVLRNGRLTEQGSHDTLMAEGGHYAELFTLQAAAYLDGTPDATPAG